MTTDSRYIECSINFERLHVNSIELKTCLITNGVLVRTFMQTYPFEIFGPGKPQPRIRPQEKDLLMEEKWDQAHEDQTSTREEKAKRLGRQCHGCQPPMRAFGIRADNRRTSSPGIGQFPLRIGSFSLIGVTQIVAQMFATPRLSGARGYSSNYRGCSPTALERLGCGLSGARPRSENPTAKDGLDGYWRPRGKAWRRPEGY